MRFIPREDKLVYFGEIFFLLGTFFLVSALPISGFFFMLALIISLSNTKSKPLHDKWNYPLFLSIGIIIFSTLNSSIFNPPAEIANIGKLNLWVSTLNWIPLFIIFWAFQLYLKTNKQRILFAKFLVSGSIPLIFSCILQYWFKVFGPLEILNGSIVWFQKPLIDNDGISGLFSNQNYTGFWFAMLWPFSIFLIRQTSNRINKSFLITISFFILYFGILTNSRNSFLGFAISIPILFGIKNFFILFFITILFLTLYFSLISYFPIDQSKLISFIPVALIEKITTFNFNNILDIPRFEIWDKALRLIGKRPILGWGGSTFAVLYILRGGIYKIQHTHNIPLELSYNYGIPVSVILFGFTILLIYKGWRYASTNKINKISLTMHWLTSVTIVYFLQINDITYFDGKISLVMWILLSGLKCIVDEQKIQSKSA